MSIFLTKENDDGGIALPFICILVLLTMSLLYLLDDYERKQSIMKQASDVSILEVLEIYARQEAVSIEKGESRCLEFDVGVIEMSQTKTSTLIVTDLILLNGFKRRIYIKNS